MHALIDLIINKKHLLLFLLLETISLVFLFSFNGYQKSVFFTTANGVVGTTYNTISSISSYLHLKEDNVLLEEKNEILRKQVVELKQLVDKSEIHKAPRLNGLAAKYDLVPATIVNMTLHKANNLMTIDKGEADGIRPEMGVICSQGVVGIVYLTSKHYSIVMPLLNVKSSISCRLRRSQYFGSLIWKHGYADMGYVTNVPRHAKVQKNDIVETNGYSDIFPPGLPIGTVQGIGDSPDGISYLLKVKFFTPFPILRNVSVIANYTSSERKQLEDVANNPEKLDSLLNAQKHTIDTKTD